MSEIFYQYQKMANEDMEILKMKKISKEFMVQRRENIEQKIQRHVKTLAPQLKRIGDSFTNTQSS